MNHTSQSQSAINFVFGRVAHSIENQAAFVAFVGNNRVFCRMDSGKLLAELEGSLTWVEKGQVKWPKKGDLIAIQLRNAPKGGYEAETWVPFESYNEAMYYVAEAELSKSRPKVEEQQPRRKTERQPRPLPKVDTSRFVIDHTRPAAPATAPVSGDVPADLEAAFERPEAEAAVTVTMSPASPVVPAPAQS